MLASLLFPYDDDARDLIDGWLLELEKEECIVRYKIGSDSYLQVCNWLEHQKIDKPSKSKIPAFVESFRTLSNPRECSSEEGTKDQGPKDQGGEEERASAPPPPKQVSDSGSFPGGLKPLQYISGIFDRCGVVARFNVKDLASQSLCVLADEENLPMHQAAEAMEMRVKSAIKSGETVNGFWFEDGKWRARKSPQRFEPGTHDPDAIRIAAEMIESRYGQFTGRTAEEMVDQACADGIIPSGVGPPELVAIITDWHAMRAKMGNRTASASMRQ